MDKITLLQKYKVALIRFIDDLMLKFPEEGDLIISRVFLKDQIPVEEVLNLMSHRILKCTDHIKNRNDEFFLKETSIFGGVNQSSIIKFKDLWSSDRLGIEDRKAIWKWIDLMVKFGRMYKKFSTEEGSWSEHDDEE
jgi:hypothetical protein